MNNFRAPYPRVILRLRGKKSAHKSKSFVAVEDAVEVTIEANAAAGADRDTRVGKLFASVIDFVAELGIGASGMGRGIGIEQTTSE